MFVTVTEVGTQSVGTPLPQLKLPHSFEFARCEPPGYKSGVPLVIRAAQEKDRWPAFTRLLSDA
jgi:hypothetical protein